MIRQVMLVLACALAIPAWSAAQSRVYVADFLQDGYTGPAGAAAADALASALAGQFQVTRIANHDEDPGALDRAAGRASGGWLVEGGIRGLRATGESGVGLSGLGFGRLPIDRPRLGPGNLARGATVSLDGWLRVSDVAARHSIGTRTFSGWSLGLRPDYQGRSSGILEQAIDDAVNDARSGAKRAVLGLISGRLASL